MRQLHIKNDSDVTRAILETSQLAKSMGFDATAVNRIVTATSELAYNILKYAGSGEVRVQAAIDDRRTGIEIVARDRGPGIADIETAMQDHYSSSGTLGLGLPGVRRMMDEFLVESEIGRGTTVTIRAWQTKPTGLLRDALTRGAAQSYSERSSAAQIRNDARKIDIGTEFDVAYIIRPCQGEFLSGDEVYVTSQDDRLLIALIDALGHGADANVAARRAKDAIRNHRNSSVVELIGILHDALSSTVGAAVSICEINTSNHSGQYVGVGNTVGRILGKRDIRLHSTAGVVGDNLRSPRPDHFNLGLEDLLVLYSDGISDRFGIDDYPQLRYQSSKAIVSNTLERFGKHHDDASCLALRRLA